MDWSVLKANNFLGLCSISKGIFIIALNQLGIGICLFFVIDYLRPTLLTLSYAILLFFAFTCVLGIISTTKKSVFITLVYLCVSIAGVVLQTMIVAELSEVVHFLPKPENSTNTLPIVSKQDSNNNNSIVDKQLDNNIDSNKKFMDEIIHATQISKHNNSNRAHKKASKPSKPYSKFSKPFHSTNFLANNFYDSLPFVPHLGETEGESEEVSQDELPPEVNGLSKDEKSEVIAIYKIQKRPIKLISAAFFGVLLLFNIYNIWIIFTFLVNKCTNLDELKQQPEQFTPLVEGAF